MIDAIGWAIIGFLSVMVAVITGVNVVLLWKIARDHYGRS